MLKYVELKSGFNDDGPAWIAEVELSGSGKTLYFNNKAFKSWNGRGIGGNYFDVETTETYWISNPKTNGEDRHWAGGGRVSVESGIVSEYLIMVDFNTLDERRYEIVTNIQVTDRSRLHRLENEQPKKGKRIRKSIRTK